MSNNAQWKVVGVDQHEQRQYVFLSSPDLSNPREAKKRAGNEAKRRWKKKGLTVRVTTVDCVG